MASTECKDCGAGKYADSNAQQSCQLCGAGQFQSATGGECYSCVPLCSVVLRCVTCYEIRDSDEDCCCCSCCVLVYYNLTVLTDLSYFFIKNISLNYFFKIFFLKRRIIVPWSMSVRIFLSTWFDPWKMGTMWCKQILSYWNQCKDYFRCSKARYTCWHKSLSFLWSASMPKRICL